MAGKRDRVIVLGGGYAGVVTAARVARRARNAEVTLVDARASFTQRIRMHELLAGSEPATSPFAPMLERSGVKFLQGFVDAWSPERQLVAGTRAGGATWREEYDTIVLALGSRTAAPVPGVSRHALRLNEPAEIRRASVRLSKLGRGGKIVVVGAGLTGIETTCELAERFPHLTVTLVAGSRFGEPYAAAGEAHLRRRMAELRVELCEGQTVNAVERDHVQLHGGVELPFDACIWTAGFEAAPLARESGLVVVADGRAIVDDAMRAVGHENIFVTGDAAAVSRGSALLRMGCVAAGPLGAHAGDNVLQHLAGGQLVPFGFSYFIRCISLGRGDGLIQFTRNDDAPRDRVVRGRGAAWIKELVCRVTYLNVNTEVSMGVRSTWWPKAAAAAETEEIPIDEGGAVRLHSPV